MTPYYEDADGCVIYCGDCREILPALPKVDLVLTDPPYFRVKRDAWDRQWDDPSGFLGWMGQLCSLWREKLTRNGSLLVFASPQMAWGVEGEVRKHFRVLNTIRWVKREGWHNKANAESLRSYLSPWESIIFAEQRCGQMTPIAAEIRERRVSAGLLTNDIDVSLGYVRSKDPSRGTELCRRWEEGSSLPCARDFSRALRACGDPREEGSLMRLYDSLRRPFFLDDEAQRFDVWDYETVRPRPGKHPCEKPLRMIEDMVRASSLVGSVVLDCFMGSGTTLVAAKRLGRKAIGIEIEERYCEIAAERLRREEKPLFSALASDESAQLGLMG